MRFKSEEDRDLFMINFLRLARPLREYIAEIADEKMVVIEE